MYIFSTLIPHQGYWGEWSEYSKCDHSLANGVEIEIFEHVGGHKDDRGATNFALICCGETRIEGKNTDYENR